MILDSGGQPYTDSVSTFHDGGAERFAEYGGGEWRGSNVATGSAGKEWSDDERRWHVRRSRNYAPRDPLSIQALRLWVTYSIGKGLTFQAQNERTQAVLESFWNDVGNRGMTRLSAQTRRARQLLIDGEMFLALFEARNTIQVRVIDALQIDEIICNPEDSEDVWYYRRRSTERQRDGKLKEVVRLYPCIFATDARLDYRMKDGAGVEKEIIPWSRSAAAADTQIMEEPGRILHVAFAQIGARGVPLLTGALDWSRAASKFMDARVAIQQALAQFAWKEKVKGNAAAVNARVAALQSSRAIGAAYETNPPAASGSTWIENQGIDRTPIPQGTASGDAQKDLAAIIQQFAAATGIFPHYLGMGEAFRLATATAMEPPMMKMFEDFQGLWTDVWATLFWAAMERAKVPASEREIDIDFPPVLEESRAAIFDGIQKVAGVFPWVGQSREVATRAVVALGINRASEVVEAGFDAPLPELEPEPARAADGMELVAMGETEAVEALGTLEAELAEL